MAQDIQIYLGKPQVEKLPVYEVPDGRQVTIKQIIFNNSQDAAQKVTITVNTIDVMVATVEANTSSGGAYVRDTFIVLKPGDRLSLKQEKADAVNVMISGTSDLLQPLY
ncbi:TPA: hypothetical protein ACLBZV_005320 [Bacillus cereus]